MENYTNLINIHKVHFKCASWRRIWGCVPQLFHMRMSAFQNPLKMYPNKIAHRNLHTFPIFMCTQSGRGAFVLRTAHSRNDGAPFLSTIPYTYKNIKRNNCDVTDLSKYNEIWHRTDRFDRHLNTVDVNNSTMRFITIKSSLFYRRFYLDGTRFSEKPYKTPFHPVIAP